jgi:hypothetical protein
MQHPDDPEALKVQWLDESLLVHGVTMEGASARIDAHLLLAGACVGAGGAVAALVAGSVPAAVVPAAVWLGCAVGLGRRSWQASRTELPAPRRLLVELRPGQVAWTLLVGERWSMRHDHDLRTSDIVDAVPAETPLGVIVRIGLLDGGSRDIPLYGLPSGDAAWLAARIGDIL